MSFDLMTLARQGRGPLRYARPVWKALVRFRLPVVRPLWAVVFGVRPVLRRLGKLAAKLLWREPMLRYRCEDVGEGLYLEGPIPQIIGDGRIRIGRDVRIGNRTTFIVGFKVSEGAELVIGDRVSVNYQTTISVAKSVRIGDDTMIAGNVQIYDNISHPLSPARRLRHDSFTLDESSPVVIGRNCWIGNAAIIMRGVTIGDNSVVAAGSIVTKSVPPNVLVAGNPARVVKSIADDVTAPTPVPTLGEVEISPIAAPAVA